MNDYDFRALNDKEFEVLCTDLLGARDGCRFERFKPGRDLGVDGRWFRPTGREVVVQCKHRLSTPIEKLVRLLEEEELPKVKKLNPAKYILALSHPLSRTDKARIEKVFGKYVKSPSDILGREDLNDLLSKNRDVEQRHYKLWIASSNVLTYLLNKPICDRSRNKLNDIAENTKLYVQTKNHQLAFETLEKHGLVIITGAAGIGKTTLADHLSIEYCVNGFELVCLSEDIREAEAVYAPQKKQLFYFDDFLGRNYLEALSGHEGSQIVQFMKRVKRDRTKRFILTSRTTILNQGKTLMDTFEHEKLDKNEFQVTLDSFSEMDRARILYNHVWHSGLNSKYIDVIYENKRYKEIIRHSNFNPRIIRYICDCNIMEDCIDRKYWDHIEELLENPAKVWQNPFEAQHDDFGRALILLVTLNSRKISENELSESFARFCSNSTGSMCGRSDFILNMRHLVGSMLTRELDERHSAMIDLFNPSIGDYVLRRYANDTASLRAGFSALRSQESIRTLNSLCANKMIGASEGTSIARHIMAAAIDADFVGYTVGYMALCCSHFMHGNEKWTSDASVVKCVKFVCSSECPRMINDVAEVVSVAVAAGGISQNMAANFVLEACKQDPYASEIETLMGIYDKLGKTEQGRIESALQQAAVKYLEEHSWGEFDLGEVFADMDNPEDLSQAYENLEEVIRDKMQSWGFEVDDDDVSSIVGAFDFDVAILSYFDNSDDSYDDVERSVGTPYLDEIDDLFDRS